MFGVAGKIRGEGRNAKFVSNNFLPKGEPLMKTRASKTSFAILAAVVLTVGSSAAGAEAKMEFFKQEKANRPDLKCATCHSSVPKAADIAAGEKNLNETGKFYQENKNLPPRK